MKGSGPTKAVVATSWIQYPTGLHAVEVVPYLYLDLHNNCFPETNFALRFALSLPPIRQIRATIFIVMKESIMVIYISQLLLHLQLLKKETMFPIYLYVVRAAFVPS